MEGNVQAIEHLHNAVNNSVREAPTWADMEALLRYFQDEYTFRGARPVRAKECFQRYAVVIGMRTAAFASNRRTNGTLFTDKENAKPRFAGRTVSRILFRRLILGDTGDNSTLAILERTFVERRKVIQFPCTPRKQSFPRLR